MCPVCNQIDAQVLGTLRDTIWVKCRSCGCEFTQQEWERGLYEQPLPNIPTYQLEDSNDH